MRTNYPQGYPSNVPFQQSLPMNQNSDIKLKYPSKKRKFLSLIGAASAAVMAYGILFDELDTAFGKGLYILLLMVHIALLLLTIHDAAFCFNDKYRFFRADYC